jgi:malonate-semialdehyde dehydrogenase (acetylating)/methylmalonate-semialdehyde dehydrogenase
MFLAARTVRLSPVSRRTYATLSTLNTVSRTYAEKLSADWKGTNATGANTKNYIGGEFVESRAAVWHDVVDPVCAVSLTPTCLTHPFIVVDTNLTHTRA